MLRWSQIDTEINFEYESDSTSNGMNCQSPVADIFELFRLL